MNRIPIFDRRLYAGMVAVYFMFPGLNLPVRYCMDVSLSQVSIDQEEFNIKRHPILLVCRKVKFPRQIEFSNLRRDYYGWDPSIDW